MNKNELRVLLTVIGKCPSVTSSKVYKNLVAQHLIYFPDESPSALWSDWGDVLIKVSIDADNTAMRKIVRDPIACSFDHLVEQILNEYVP